VNQHQPQASEYDMAMGRDPGRQAEDERFAFGSHRDELTGDLAQVRDAHARADIDRAAAGLRQRQADREAGA
jgi:hypothetical protein